MCNKPCEFTIAGSPPAPWRKWQRCLQVPNLPILTNKQTKNKANKQTKQVPDLIQFANLLIYQSNLQTNKQSRCLIYQSNLQTKQVPDHNTTNSRPDNTAFLFTNREKAMLSYLGGFKWYTGKMLLKDKPSAKYFYSFSFTSGIWYCCYHYEACK